MARKYDLISELYSRTCKELSSDPTNWQAFLRAACRNYKLRYDEQLLVYAQRPDATAVLEIERWNKYFGRWVNRGANGIAVFEEMGGEKQKLIHYFDISDTHESQYSRPVPIWGMKAEYEGDIIETLENTFGAIGGSTNLADAILCAARNATEDNVPDYMNDLSYSIENSYLEGLEEDMLISLYKSLVEKSVAYMMMCRLGVDTESYFDSLDFSGITDFNTQDTLNALGFATSDIAGMGLSEIARTIMALERRKRMIAVKGVDGYNEVEKDSERGLENERIDVHDGGRFQLAESGNADATEGESGQVRPDEEKVFERTSQGNVLQHADEGESGRALDGGGTESRRDGRTARDTDGGKRRGDGANESGGYDFVGSKDEQSQKLGAGNGEGGGDIRLLKDINQLPSINQQLTFIETRAEGKETSAFIIPQKVADNVPYVEALNFATKLVRFVQDFDYYEYKDNLEIDDSEEDIIAVVAEKLSDKEYVRGIESYLNNTKDELSETSQEYDEINKLISEIGLLDLEERSLVSEHEINQNMLVWKQSKKSKVKSFDLHPKVPMAERLQFDLKASEVEIVGKKERFRRNVDAIQVLKKCDIENRFATLTEQTTLSKYVGWGGIPEAFDGNNGAWADEFEELRKVLSPDEYASARESTLTAFYTPPEVISAIYKAMERMGFREGNLLEPSCGIGNFIGMLPDSMQESKVYGVELDTISAGIARQLYQKSSVVAQGFEEVGWPDSFFDGVVGNVPFGDFKVLDKRYDKQKFLIHDYFFAKSLDKVRPGGIIALVTSKGTMDKESNAVRKYIAQRAELLGAIRLPNNTFKGNAGTEVVSDILFLQKRDRIVDVVSDWVYLDTDENGIRMNSYFVRHPEMVLGEMRMVSGRFGMEPTCEPYENSDLATQLDEAVSNIHGELSVYERDGEPAEEDNSILADPTVRNFSYTVLNGKLFFRENSRMSPITVSATAENRIKGMIVIRDSVRKLIEMQTEDYPDEDIRKEQSRLNVLYDGYTKKYGLLNDRANVMAFSQDGSFSLLAALEVIGEDGKLERKADMFFKRTIKPHVAITKVDTASEALAVSVGEKAEIDMEYMCQLTGKAEEEIAEELKGVIFLNPLYDEECGAESKYLMADEYLSGNVREKLQIAKRSAQSHPNEYQINVEALEKVQPKDLSASEISVRLGATWLPPKIVEDFMFEFLETPFYLRRDIRVHFSKYTGAWNIEGKSNDRVSVKSRSTYGTSRINAYKIIEETLNLKDVRIFDYIEDEDGKKKAVLNKSETAIAQGKQELVKQGFQDWVWENSSRRERLTKLYNEKFNSIRPREYDGSHITFNGMNPEIELMEHQRNAVAHILYGGNTLLAHAVGAGKTFEMVAAAQESKRLGLCSKSLFVVPNHLTEQWATEYLQLYPAANILVATKKDFETKNRKRFCGRIATGEYDAVIIGHSQFEKIPMSLERQKKILRQQLEELVEGIEELERNRGERFSIKQLEKSRKSIKQKLDKLNNQSQKDDVVTFEELGVDRLFVDESHYYKNLFLYTKMRNVGGIAQTEAQKSSDLFMKCRYLDEITGGRGIVFATGTPISNSMVELYTIQRYLQYDTLQKNGLQHFDAWASTFGETVTAVELTPEGTSYRAKTRFAKFYNLPELMTMFKEVADIKTADMLHLPVPEVEYHNVAVKPSETQKEMVAALGERAEKVRGGLVDSSVDNMLKITNDGRKLALDQRMMGDMLPDFEGSKINACVDNIYRIWKETMDKKSAQLVFCDLSTPKNDGTFSVYDDIRKKLVRRGIPEEEVRFIHEADTDAKKKELFRKTRKGEVRVLLGSTQKMGAGTNVQDKLIALHDCDCPWRPSDVGRILRAFNHIYKWHLFYLMGKCHLYI